MPEQSGWQTHKHRVAPAGRRRESLLRATAERARGRLAAPRRLGGRACRLNDQRCARCPKTRPGRPSRSARRVVACRPCWTRAWWAWTCPRRSEETQASQSTREWNRCHTGLAPRWAAQTPAAVNAAQTLPRGQGKRTSANGERARAAAVVRSSGRRFVAALAASGVHRRSPVAASSSARLARGSACEAMQTRRSTRIGRPWRARSLSWRHEPQVACGR